jgi:exopolysaccharide biosynthesis polyprenyl glycosylphosphotransferase
MASLAAAGLILEGAGRLALRSGLGLLHRRGRLGRALVAGTGREAVELIRALQHPGSDLRPVGVLDLGDPVWSGGGSAERVPRLRAALRDHGAHCVFVAPSGVGTGPLVDLVRAARHEGQAVRVFTPMPGVLPWRGSLHPCGPGGLAIGLRPVRLSPGQRALKRSLDLAGAALALVAGLPLMAAVAVAVKLSSPGPVLYRQDRVTRGGRTFPMYKFRTMTAGPPPEGGGIDPSALFFKLREDPRVTSVGRVLRRLSLDELPQLFNVIRGDMSLVGPRPLAADQVAGNEDLLGPRHEVRAGMTGWWQVNGRSDVPPDQAVQMDLLYVENWSLALDLYILLRTVGALAGGRGAY